MAHPCIGCINNWSSEPLPCANVCNAIQVWINQDDSFDEQEEEMIEEMR